MKFGKYFEGLDIDKLSEVIRAGMIKLDNPIHEDERVTVLFNTNNMDYELQGIVVETLIPAYCQAHFDFNKFFELTGLIPPREESEKCDFFLKNLDEMSAEFYPWLCQQINMADYAATIDLKDEFWGDVVIKLAKGMEYLSFEGWAEKKGYITEGEDQEELQTLYSEYLKTGNLE